MAEFECPSYDGDVEADAGVPAPAQEFCRRLQAADALMIASPEYNASMPGVLKNLIDWTSRLRPQPFNGKQAFLLSASPSMAGRTAASGRCGSHSTSGHARLSGHVLASAGARGVRRRWAVEERPAPEAVRRALGCFIDLVEAALRYPGLKKQWVEFLGEQPNAATNRVETNETEAA